jgi:DNA-binding IclR family transcriptional regulator
MTTATRDIREVVRDEHVRRHRILAALAEGPLTIPEIAEAIGQPAREVVFWVMGMRKYGYLTEIREVTDEGFFRYRVVEGRGA